MRLRHLLKAHVLIAQSNEYFSAFYEFFEHGITPAKR